MAAAPAENSRRIVAAAPKAPTQAQAAAKPGRAATPVKPANDDDDEEDVKPRKVAQAASQPLPKPVAPQAKPAQPSSQTAQPARPQPRVIPMTPQKPKEEEPPARSASLMQADPTTTQSIPPQKPAATPAPAPAASAEERADFRWPARGRVISGFGSKGGNGDGIAIAVPEGTPVKAAGDGVVAYAGEELKGYGKLVLVRHENGYVSAYAHNGELNVKRGEKVSRGQTIARSARPVTSRLRSCISSCARVRHPSIRPSISTTERVSRTPPGVSETLAGRFPRAAAFPGREGRRSRFLTGARLRPAGERPSARRDPG